MPSCNASLCVITVIQSTREHQSWVVPLVKEAVKSSLNSSFWYLLIMMLLQLIHNLSLTFLTYEVREVIDMVSSPIWGDTRLLQDVKKRSILFYYILCLSDFTKQKLPTSVLCTFSNMRIWFFSLFYILVSGILGGFGLLSTQNKQCRGFAMEIFH